LDHGAAFPQPDGELKYRFVPFIRSTTVIVLPAKEFTTTEPPYCDSWVYFANRKLSWDESDF
jgi:hypothetical protein